MHQKYEQRRGEQGETYFKYIVKTKTKINESIQSGLHLENIRKLAFWLNGDV